MAALHDPGGKKGGDQDGEDETDRSGKRTDDHPIPSKFANFNHDPPNCWYSNSVNRTDIGVNERVCQRGHVIITDHHPCTKQLAEMERWLARLTSATQTRSIRRHLDHRRKRYNASEQRPRGSTLDFIKSRSSSKKAIQMGPIGKNPRNNKGDQCPHRRPPSRTFYDSIR